MGVEIVEIAGFKAEVIYLRSTTAGNDADTLFLMCGGNPCSPMFYEVL